MLKEKSNRRPGTYQSGDVTPSSWLPNGDTLRPELDPDPTIDTRQRR